jgi:hypothetical protein
VVLLVLVLLWVLWLLLLLQCLLCGCHVHQGQSPLRVRVKFRPQTRAHVHALPLAILWIVVFGGKEGGREGGTKEGVRTMRGGEITLGGIGTHARRPRSKAVYTRVSTLLSSYT